MWYGFLEFASQCSMFETHKRAFYETKLRITENRVGFTKITHCDSY